MATRSARLFGPTLIAGTGWTSLYTAPVDMTVLVKSLRIVSLAGSDPVTFDLATPVADADGALFWQTTLEPLHIVVDRSWFVIAGGEELFIRCSLAGVVVVRGDGAELP